jgi:hypothetical protein
MVAMMVTRVGRSFLLSSLVYGRPLGDAVIMALPDYVGVRW